MVGLDPETGEVVSWIDLAGILEPDMRTGNEDVLNGIAYDAQNDRLIVTGKRWPLMFHIDLVPVEPEPTTRYPAQSHSGAGEALVVRASRLREIRYDKKPRGEH